MYIHNSIMNAHSMSSFSSYATQVHEEGYIILPKMSNYVLKSEIDTTFPISNVQQNVAQYILEKVDYFVKRGGGDLPCVVSLLL